MYKHVSRAALGLACAAIVAWGARAGDGSPEAPCGRPWPAVSVPHVQITLSSKLDETIQALAVEEGQSVRKGDVLLAFDDRLIAARIRMAEKEADFEARIARARATVRYREGELKRNRQAGDVVTGEELAQSAHAVELARLELKTLETQRALALATLDYYKAQAENYVLRAPIDGVVSRVWIETGEMAQKGQPLVEMISPDRLEVRVHLPETCALLQPGRRALVRFQALEQKVFEGKVTIVAPYVESASGTLEVRVLVTPATPAVKPGMACQVEFPPAAAKVDR
jgi:RND family efflux transporter MFP subunit